MTNNAEKDAMPKVEKMIHPTLFYLATCSGWATQSMINDFLAQIFGVTEKRIEWEMAIGNLRAELIKDEYIFEPNENKKDIWELTNTGRIEIVNEMMAFHFMWDAWKKEYCYQQM
jgi:hypothetical protein